VPTPPTLAVITFAFDPIVTFGGWSVRLETLGLAVVIFLALVAAAVFARRTPVDTARSADDEGREPGQPNHLRADDLLFIAVAAIPGAVVGGRIGYALLHLDYVEANSGVLFDPGWGGLELALGVVGGVVTAAIVARLLVVPIGRWLHALVLPLLFALGAGKLAMALGGSGQGLPSAETWATAYVSPGPWGSLAPALPSHPSQVYEAIATGVVLLAVLGLLFLGAFGRRTGGAFLLGLGLWAAARAAVATTWRDPAVVGPLSMGQVIAITIAVASFVLLVAASGIGEVRRRRADTAAERAADAGPSWPDPSTRPGI
jgi:phosphatidylglycerol---prolipoprotein diacylglyceryl transferase